MRARFLLILPLLAACTPQEEPTGAEDFAAFCSGCHGATGVGDGPMASGLEARPADLTGLSARNGGEFPKLRVMAKIWGYTGGPAVPVKKVMRQAQKPGVAFRHQGAEVLRIIAQKAREGRLIDRFGHCGLVKGQIVGPKPAPFRLVSLPQGAYLVGHRVSLKFPVTLAAKVRLGNGPEIVRIASGRTGPGIADRA
jgi:hypothetical protein